MGDRSKQHDFAGLMVNRFYADLPLDVRSSIESRGQLKVVPAQGQLYVKGEKGDGVYALLKGKVEYRMLSSSGKQSLVNIVEEGKWLGYVSTPSSSPKSSG